MQLSKVDDDGKPTCDMELMDFSDMLKTSACSKACWIGAVNLLEAAAAAEYRGRRTMYSRDGGWKNVIPGEVYYLLDKRIRDGERICKERWFVVFHAGNVFESRYIFKERCRDWTDDLENCKECAWQKRICRNEYAMEKSRKEYAWQIDSMHDRLMNMLGRLKTLAETEQSDFAAVSLQRHRLEPCLEEPYEYAWPCRVCMKRRKKELARHRLWLEKRSIVDIKLQRHGNPTVIMQSMAMSLLNLGPKKMHKRIANLITDHAEWERVREEEMQAQFAFQKKLEDLLLDKHMPVEQKLEALGLNGWTSAGAMEGLLAYRFKYGWKKNVILVSIRANRARTTCSIHLHFSEFACCGQPAWRPTCAKNAEPWAIDGAI